MSLSPGTTLVGEDPKGCFVPGWKTNPWTEPILEETLMESDDLVQAITDRLPPDDADWVDISTTDAREEPLASADQLQLLSSISGFPRAFLQRAKKPRCKFIAPGLTIFDGSSSQNPHPQVQEHPDTERREEQAGLWILPEWDWADSVVLVLPYTLSSYPLGDGRSVQWPTSTRLFQTRGCPYFVHHRTRLASMLRRWRRLVEEGIWTVGPDGVEGGMDFYRQAEDPEKREWFTSGEDCFEFRIPVSIEVEL
ncbi:hypothetical protein VTN00DRAFT_6947 [Thermoascus crustaceus]|uniref:uncharacterized protein n=1 Tax=Thermoascus crustaceus TaxID=5088 RepID=UPI003742940E